MVISCRKICKSFGAEEVLTDITFLIEDREKAAVIGVNGAGKTTLFKILTGELTEDGGEISLAKDAKLGYLSQNMQLDSKNSIYNELLSVFEPIIEMERELRELEARMAGLKGQALESAMASYAQLSHLFEENDGYGYESRIRGVIKGLNFNAEESNQPICELSGGQKTRVCLGKLLLSKPDLLLLDEPTNHLDIESVRWLEEYLRSFTGAVIVISHDRYFLDKIATKIIEIENKRSVVYNGNYSFYAQKKEVDREIQIKHYLDQQKLIKHHEEVISRFKMYNTERSVRLAESRAKLLDKIERVDKPESGPGKMRLGFTPTIKSGNDIVSVRGAGKSFGSNHLFSDVDFDIYRGERIALIGPNGIGKTTLFKMLLGEITDYEGEIRFGTNVRPGYYDQEHEDLSDEKTIIEEISDAYPRMTNGEIRNTLAAFVFTEDDVFKSIASLSGGEKGRVMLAKLMLSKSNFLLLDEPTNHLDVYSKEILEDAILRYEGTCLYISHDRYFINRTATKILEMSATGILSYTGNYDYYMEKKLQARQNEEAAETVQKTVKTENRVSWAQKKDDESNRRKKKSLIERLEKSIEEAEHKQEEIERLLLRDEVGADYVRATELYVQKEELAALIDDLYSQWNDAQED